LSEPRGGGAAKRSPRNGGTTAATKLDPRGERPGDSFVPPARPSRHITLIHEPGAANGLNDL